MADEDKVSDADETPDDGETPDGGVPGNGEDALPPLIINGQYVKDLSFEAPETPGVFMLLQEEMPEIPISVEVNAEALEDNQYEVILKVHGEARVKDTLVYIVEVVYAGVFTLNVPEEHLGPALLIECPRLMFPFLRNVISDVTRDGGFAPLMLAPIDFLDLYQQRVAAAQAEEAAGGGGGDKDDGGDDSTNDDDGGDNGSGKGGDTVVA